MAKKKNDKKKSAQPVAEPLAAAGALIAAEPVDTQKKHPKYQDELERLQTELAHLQAWVKSTGARIIVVFEGRDAAGKGGIIKRLAERVSPRIFRVTALPPPSDREKSQLYLQRYFQHFPAAGEIVIFDRSWYNRPGVERVMGFASDAQVQDFLEVVPGFERLITRSGIILLKYFIDVSEKEQEKRFRARIDDPLRQWKLSPMDVDSYQKWWDYSAAYDDMINRTDTEHAPWWIVPSDNKKKARINCITHLLASIPYERVKFIAPDLGDRQKRPKTYKPSGLAHNVVPDVPIAG